MCKIKQITFFLGVLIVALNSYSQRNNIQNTRDILFKITSKVSAKNIQNDIEALVSFGTRHTLSDTVSNQRGIGAARRWIKQEFESISNDCDQCLEVVYQRNFEKANSKRLVHDVEIVNVLAIQKGYLYPNRYIIMSGDIDSRVSNVNNFMDDAPGANDNATGIAGTLEAARLLSLYKFPASIIYVGLSGEEQGLYGGKHLAEMAKEKGWEIIGVLNNDMIGNIEGIDGVVDNTSFRIFSEAVPATITERQRNMMRYYGGEVDGPSRQLARYIDLLTDQYMTNLDAKLIYRLDRFGRGGHHKPFNDQGFPGVRIMETHENYNRQHQDLRTENGIKYGDVIEGVNFEYVAKLTAVNAITLASLASAPIAPINVKIGGAVKASTTLSWDVADDSNLLGFKIYYRDTDAPNWQKSIFIGKVHEYHLKNLVIDNYLFGVASVAKNGAESVVQFPTGIIRD